MWHFSIFVISSVICSINEMYLCLQILKTYQCSSMVKEVSKLVPKVAPLFHKKSSVFKVATATSSPTFWAATCSTVRFETVNDKTWLKPNTFTRNTVLVYIQVSGQPTAFTQDLQPPRAGCWLTIKGSYTISPLCHFVCNTSKRSLVRVSV